MPALTGDVTTSAGAVATTVVTVGTSTAANVHAAEVLANAATNANTASAIVKRDSSGNFSAGAISSGSLILRDSTTHTITMAAPSSVTTYALTWPAADGSSGQVLSTDGSGTLSWVTASGGGGGSGTVTSLLAGTGLTGGTITTTGTLAVNVGTGNNQIVQLDGSAHLPAVDGSALTNLDPTHLSAAVGTAKGGTGLTAIGTANQVMGVNSGATGLEYKTITAGTNITVTHGANSITIAASGGGSGSVTSIASGTGLTGGPITATGTFAVDVGTGNNQIVQLDGSAHLPAVNGSALTNLNATNLASGTVAAARLPALTGDVTTSAGSAATTVVQVQGTAVDSTAPTTAGQVLRYNGTTKYIAGFLSLADIRSTVTPVNTMFPSSTCTAAQTMTWSSLTDTMTCTTIAISNSAVSGLGTAALLDVGTAASKVVQLDGSAHLPAVDGSALTSLDPTHLSAAVGTAKGGTGLTSIGTANQILGVNNGASGLEYKTMTAGTGITVTHGANSVTIAATNTNAGTVTSIATGSGLSGGAITNTGTISLASTAANTMLANATGSGAVPTAVTASAFLDSAISNTQGSIMYRNGSGWVALAPGTSGYSLQSQGSSANLQWSQTDLTSGVTGTLPVANGGTGTASGSITGTGTLTFAAGGSNTHVILTPNGSGGVGIGTTTPGTMLDVAGQSVLVRGTGTTAGEIRLAPGPTTGTNYVGFSAPTTNPSSSVMWRLPAADGTSGQVLSTNGSGTLSWATASGSGGSATVTTYTTAGTATWTKPASGGMTLIECWGGGGSGGRAGASGTGGGGGGGYIYRFVPLSSLGATETVTVAAGGASVTSGTTNGNVGGTSSFGTWLSAYGGGGGAAVAPYYFGGGGGGSISAGSTYSSTNTITGGAPDGGNGGFGGDNGYGACYGTIPGSSTYGGGGGSGLVNARNCYSGGNSVFGGAGGGGCFSTTANSGGTSKFGGNGGAGGSTAAAAGTAGTQPGGGGGGSNSGNSGAGAAGKCQITVW